MQRDTALASRGNKPPAAAPSPKPAFPAAGQGSGSNVITFPNAAAPGELTPAERVIYGEAVKLAVVLEAEGKNLTVRAYKDVHGGKSDVVAKVIKQVKADLTAQGEACNDATEAR
jgi:hypothetical protein